MLLAPFLAVSVMPISHRRLEAAKRAAVMVLASLAVVAPITMRNYVVYREFVPVSINGGISLWHGIAAAGGQRFGARSRDKLVIAEEALAHQNPAYEEWWAAPDGIHRDRLRYRMALGVIRDHPLWYARAMLGRMRDMLRYASGTPPPVKRSYEGVEASEREELVRAMRAGDRHAEPGGSEDAQSAPDLRAPISTQGLLRTGQWLSPLRLPVWTLQAATSAVMLGFIVAGAAAVLFLSWRTAAFLFLVPAYYFLVESIFFLEWRVVVPLHYSLFVFAATAWALAAALVREGARRAGNAVLGRLARTPA
jgi:hypothetical protein